MIDSQVYFSFCKWVGKMELISGESIQAKEERPFFNYFCFFVFGIAQIINNGEAGVKNS